MHPQDASATAAPPKARLVDCASPDFKPEVITQKRLKQLHAAEKGLWLASQRVHLLALDIKAAIERGAHVESGEIVFFPEMNSTLMNWEI